LAPKPETLVIVNCAGRTRSIIGTQSLINAGIPNPIAALRNGAIGWRLARQRLAHGASLTFPQTSEVERLAAEQSARAVAVKAGLKEVSAEEVARWVQDRERTTYLFDVRTPGEYVEGHLPGFRSAPGGQLVQETNMFAPVRGARIVLCDTDGVRARMTGSWLRQMGWEAWTISRVAVETLTQTRSVETALPPLPEIPDWAEVNFESLQSHANDVVLDFSPGIVYRAGHLADSLFASRDHLDEVLANIASYDRYVVTASDPVLALFAWNDIRGATDKPVLLLDRNSIPVALLSSASPRYACTMQDRYMRPYEGTAAGDGAMQAYLVWEAGLVEQLERDGTHHFFVI
jgi:rhodanese-related sulfurtransferase